MKKNRGDDKDFCLKNLIEGVMFLNLDVYFIFEPNYAGFG